MNNLEVVFLRIAPDKFHFLKFILEGYDNMAILSSISSKEGLAVVRYPQELGRDLFAVLGNIARKIS